MAGKNTAVFGIYSNRTSVESAVDALKTAEFRNSDISVLFPENTGTKDFAHEKNTKAPEGATTGAGTGALLGGGLGWLVGIGAIAAISHRFRNNELSFTPARSRGLYARVQENTDCFVVGT